MYRNWKLSHNNRIFGFIAPAQDQDISSKQLEGWVFAWHNLTNAAEHRFALEGRYDNHKGPGYFSRTHLTLEHWKIIFACIGNSTVTGRVSSLKFPDLVVDRRNCFLIGNAKKTGPPTKETLSENQKLSKTTWRKKACQLTTIGQTLPVLPRFKGITSDLFPGVVLPEPDFGALTSKLGESLGAWIAVYWGRGVVA